MMENNKEKKSTGKKVLSIVIVVFLIVAISAGVGIGAYFAYKNYSENKSTGTEWGDLYYNYIKDNKEGDTVNKSNFVKLEENVKIGFAEVDTIKNPVMFVNETKIDENNQNTDFVSLYKINDNKEVVSVGGYGSKSADIEFLYDVPNKKYNYFIHTSNEAEDTYISVDTAISDSEKQSEIRDKVKEEKGNSDFTNEDYTKVINEFEEYKKNETTRAEYIISKTEEKITQNTLSGDVITYDKKDEFIIDTGVEERKFNLSKDMESSDLRKNIETEVTEYKKNEEIATDEVKTVVEEKLKSTETTKKQIETAKTEIKAEEERKAAEEEKRKEEEELKKGLKVGKYRLKYGTYKTDAAQMGDFYGTLELKPNGVFHIKSNCDIYSASGGAGYEKIDEDGTYKVTKVLNSFTYFDGLEFTTKTGKKFSLEAVKSMDGSVYLGDQWHSYRYQGN